MSEQLEEDEFHEAEDTPPEAEGTVTEEFEKTEETEDTEDTPPPEEPKEEEEPKPPPPPPINQDALSMEFLYYGSVLKGVAPALSQMADRESMTPWITKLFRPEYQTSKLREKRNRYLSSLTCNLLNDEVTGIFVRPPPTNALEEINAIPIAPSTTADWELDRMWQETLLALPDGFEMMKCSVHATPEECQEDHKLDRVLDQEFQFLLYLTRPYATLLPAEDKTRTAAWLQVLCSIHGNACSSMKAMRNDYIMALLGYLHDLRIVGPFVDYPPDKLVKLADAAKEAAKTHPVMDPAGHDANQFLLDQPVPDDGAFCYVALTGDLVASHMQ